VLGVPALVLAEPWHELERAQVLKGEQFAHDLVDDALLRSVPAAIARHLHARVAEWLAALREALVACGGWEALACDEAGRAVLSALRLDPTEGAPAAWSEATASTQLGLDGFVAWTDAVFEAATFRPAAPPAEAVQVVITPLAQVMLRPFAAVVMPGADDRHLGAPPAAHPLLSEAELQSLGLEGRGDRQQREALRVVAERRAAGQAAAVGEEHRPAAAAAEVAQRGRLPLRPGGRVHRRRRTRDAGGGRQGGHGRGTASGSPGRDASCLAAHAARPPSSQPALPWAQVASPVEVCECLVLSVASSPATVGSTAAAAMV